jgi:hypothetical protein
MFSAKWRKNLLTYSAVLVGIIALTSQATQGVAQAQGYPGYWGYVRTIEVSRMGVEHPAGLTYSPQDNAFLIAEAGASRIVMLTPTESPAGTLDLGTALQNPLNFTFDGKGNRLLSFDPATQELVEIKATSGGVPDPASIRRFDARALGLQNPRALTVDPASGRLYLLDSGGQRIIRIEPASDGSLDVGAALKADRVSSIDLKATGLGEARGLAFNPADGHLYLLNPANQALYELTESGQVVVVRNLFDSGDFDLVDPQGMVFAPSSDQTDDPANQSLYIADSRQGDKWQRSGNIIELSVSEPRLTAQPSSSTSTAPLGSGPALAATGDPVFVGAGDIASCSQIHDDATANLLDNIPGTVYDLGDNVYPNGTLDEYNNCYDPTWGRQKARTHPSAGNHEYDISGGAVGYFNYFGAAASPLEPSCTSNCKGYYSYDLGAWHIIVLNSNCSQIGGCGTTSPQGKWLQADLAAHPSTCTLAYWHHPLFSSTASNTSGKAFWALLYAAGADIVLNGHQHQYERFALQDPNGVADPVHGIREFVVGTGGAGLGGFNTIAPNSEVRNGSTWGVLKLTLHSTSYDWQFVPIAGQTFTDSGSASCVTASGSIPTPTPTSTPTPGGPTPTPTPTTTPNSSDLIFADSFESGNLSAWSSSTTDSGNLSVSSAAALVGNQGMQALINDNNSIFVTDDTPNAEPRYRVRFYFDPNSISMASGDNHFIFRGFTGASTLVLRVQFRFRNGSYALRAALRDDASTWTSSNWFTISDAPHSIELDWRAASAVGANDGGLTFWLDGAQQANLTNIDNDTRRIDRIRLGAVAGIDSGTRGTEYFDAFESRRQTYIGP